VRRVGIARGGGLAGVTDLIGLLRAIDSAGVDVRSSALTYTATWGGVNDVLNPRAGWVARVSAEIAGPSPVSTVEYGRLAASYDRFVPLGTRSALVARVGFGRLAPFGRSVPTPGEGDRITSLLRLRDVVFTAGGTDDVRGWATDLLGPKVPDFTVTTRGDTVELRSAGRYVPLGGLARVTGSLELRAPMPLVGGPHSIFAFVDGGRIWIPDERFQPIGGLASIGDRFYAGTGGGLQFGTPAGPLRIAVGYKLNPSPLDLRDPGRVADALLLGQPLESVPPESGRRWHLHLSIGRPF
jgi:outer membrane protein assembly factor BamA